MTSKREAFAEVMFLLPRRVQQGQARFVAALRAELAAIIAAIGQRPIPRRDVSGADRPTAATATPPPQPGLDPRRDHGGAWPVLPSHPEPETDDGHA